MADKEINGHYYVSMQQGPAICLYCNNCSEPKCCPQGDCQRTVLNEINGAIKRAKLTFNAPSRRTNSRR